MFDVRQLRCHSSKRLPSGSVAQPNRPYSYSSTRSSMIAPAEAIASEIRICRRQSTTTPSV